MAERWKAWKTKIRFPKLPTAPWKSRKSGEIPTFPPLRLFLCVHINTAEAKELWAVGKWKSKSRIPTFPRFVYPYQNQKRKENQSRLLLLSFRLISRLENAVRATTQSGGDKKESLGVGLGEDGTRARRAVPTDFQRGAYPCWLSQRLRSFARKRTDD